MTRMHAVGKRWITSLAAACAVGPACATEPQPAEPVVRPVHYVTVWPRDVRRTRTFAGAARAGTESSLSFRVGGAIARINVEIGDRVRAGAPLARIDPMDYELQAQEAEATLREARALAENASADLRRAWALYENDNVSRTDLDAAVAAADSTAARVEAVAKRLERARWQVRHTELAAPADGAVAAVLVAANENVRAGQPVVLLTSDLAPEVEFAVPESLIREIREGTPVSAVFNAIPEIDFTGVVSEVGVAASATGTVYTVVVRLAGAGSAVRPGMAAEVSVPFGADADAERIVLPGPAVGEDRDGRFVFVAATLGDGLAMAHRRPVSIGAVTGNGFEIAAGLWPGARVITAGVSRIRHGDVIRLQDGGSSVARARGEAGW